MDEHPHPQHPLPSPTHEQQPPGHDASGHHPIQQPHHPQPGFGGGHPAGNPITAASELPPAHYALLLPPGPADATMGSRLQYASNAAKGAAKTAGQGAISAAEALEYVSAGTAAIINPAANAIAILSGAVAGGAASIAAATYQGVQSAGQKVYNPQN
jgi:hypothetical protein